MTSQSNQEGNAVSFLSELQARIDAVSPNDYAESNRAHPGATIVGEAPDHLKRLYTVLRQMHAERGEVLIADTAWADEMDAKFGPDAEETPEHSEAVEESKRRDQASLKSKQSFDMVYELLRVEALRAFPEIPAEASVLFLQGWQVGFIRESPQILAFVLGGGFVRHSQGEEHHTH